MVVTEFTLPVALVLLIQVLTSVQALSSPSRPFQISHLDHIVLKCKHFDKMFFFYTDILGCTVDHAEDVGRFGGALTHLRAGPNTMIDLLSLDTNHLTVEGQAKVLQLLSRSSESIPTLFNSSFSTLDHFCLRIDPFDESYLVDYFEEHDICVLSSGLRKGAQGVGPSLYIQDPEGNVIELKGPSTVRQKQQPSKQQEQDFTSRGPRTIPGFAVQGMDTIGRSSSDSNAVETSTGIDKKSTTAVPSTPCTRICRYNANFFDGQVCIGCFREAYEIGTWAGMTGIEKSYTLLDAADRTKLLDGTDNSYFEGSISQDELLRQAEYWKEKSKEENK